MGSASEAGFERARAAGAGHALTVLQFEEGLAYVDTTGLANARAAFKQMGAQLEAAKMPVSSHRHRDTLRRNESP